MKTKYEKIKHAIGKLESSLREMERDKKQQEKELEKYAKRHRSLKYDGLETSDVEKLRAIYSYFDASYPVQWQGGLRCDDRGMRLCYWIEDDPEYLVLHITSTSDNICFGGSTSWLVKASTLADKEKVLTKIKKDVQKIIK